MMVFSRRLEFQVSPWMRNGNIREYVRINPNVDGLRLLSEVASGVYNVPSGMSATLDILINGSFGIPSRKRDRPR
jgi:hypothetical protein